MLERKYPIKLPGFSSGHQSVVHDWKLSHTIIIFPKVIAYLQTFPWQAIGIEVVVFSWWVQAYRTCPRFAYFGDQRLDIGHVIFGLFQGAKWFFPLTEVWEVLSLVGQRGKCALLLLLPCKCDSSIHYGEVKKRQKLRMYEMLMLGMLKSGFNCCLYLFPQDLCNFRLTREHK